MLRFKTLALVAILMVVLAGRTVAQEAGQGTESGNYSSFKVSLVPGAALGDNPHVAGLDFGLVTRTEKLEGAQCGIIFADITGYGVGVQCGLCVLSGDFDGSKFGLITISRNFRGYQTGLVNVANDFIGYQKGFINVTQSLKGVQTGVINISHKTSGLQFGVCNYTDTLTGWQIGVFNIITRSSLPCMVLVNAAF